MKRIALLLCILVLTAFACQETERGRRPPRLYEDAPSSPRAGDKPDSKAADECDPNYKQCVPKDVEDVDCEGGDGDGPEYVQGPIEIIGRDIYDLDGNGDKIACEPSDTPKRKRKSRGEPSEGVP